MAKGLGLLFACSVLALPVRAAHSSAPAGVASYGNLPLYFEPAAGSSAVNFNARGRLSAFAVSPTEAVLTLTRAEMVTKGQAARPEMRYAGSRSLRFEMIGAKATAAVAGEGVLSGTANYFVGSDASKWRTAVPLFERVRVSAIYPGIDLIYYGNEQRLEYDFVIAPGTSPNAVAIRITGADQMRVDEAGDLVLTLGDETIRQPKPVIYQTVAGERKSVAGGYRLQAGVVTFEVDEYDRALPLTIDPVLSYSSYFGGTGLDVAWAVATDAQGAVYVAGETMGGLPTSGAIVPPEFKFDGPTTLQGDAFIAKFSASTTNLVYLAYVGGKQHDVALSLAIDGATGNAYLTGNTDSTDFPVSTNALFPTLHGTPYPGLPTPPTDAFVTELGAQGTNLIYSTFLGGDWVDRGVGIGLDAGGNIYVAGYTESTNFPNTNAIVSTNGFNLAAYSRGGDAFVTKLSADGSSVIYSLYLGGTNFDLANDVAVTAEGAYVGGYSSSTNFPAFNGAQTNLPGLSSAFVTFVPNNVSTFVATDLTSTFMGGTLDSAVFRLATDGNNFFATGFTDDPTFPVIPSGINPGGIVRTVDSGNAWDSFNAGLKSVVVPTIVITPGNPQNMYAGTWHGVVRSTDGGATWQGYPNVAPRTNGLESPLRVGVVAALAIDPSDPNRIYAGTGLQGVFVSTNAGLAWSLSNSNMGNRAVNALAMSPNAPGIIFAGTENGIMRSINSGGVWSNSLANVSVRAIAFDPVNPLNMYAGLTNNLYRTVNGGTNWTVSNTGLSVPGRFVQALLVTGDSTVYAGTKVGVYKSVNRGTNWAISNVGLTNANVLSLALDGGNNIIYAGTTNGIFKSANAGESWTLVNSNLPVRSVLSLAVNPESPSIIYAGLGGTPSFGGHDAFLVKSSAAGLERSAVFGGLLSDEGWDVALDGVGNAYVVGATTSTNFPVKNVGTLRGTNSGGTSDAFIAEINPAGDAFVFSAYHGGSGRDLGYGVTVDPLGNVYFVGETASANFPKALARQNTFGGNRDAFLAKLLLGSAPLLVESLNILTTNSLDFTWTAYPGEYIFQASTNLLGTNQLGSNTWLDVFSPVPVSTNGQQWLSIDPNLGPRPFFFRLRSR